MTRYLTIAALVLVLALGAALWWQTDRLTDARADVAHWRAEAQTAARRIAQAEEAASVHRAHLDRMEAEAARYADLDAALGSMEGGDAPLDAYLSDAARRLWGRQ